MTDTIPSESTSLSRPTIKVIIIHIHNYYYINNCIILIFSKIKSDHNDIFPVQIGAIGEF